MGICWESIWDERGNAGIRLGFPEGYERAQDFQPYSPRRGSARKCLTAKDGVTTASCAGVLRNGQECAGVGHSFGTNHIRTDWIGSSAPASSRCHSGLGATRRSRRSAPRSPLSLRRPRLSSSPISCRHHYPVRSLPGFSRPIVWICSFVIPCDINPPINHPSPSEPRRWRGGRCRRAGPAAGRAR